MFITLEKKTDGKSYKINNENSTIHRKMMFLNIVFVEKILQMCKISIYDEILIGYNNGNNGENVMEQVSYKKLFKLLIDKDLKKTEFAAKAGISQNTLARMGKGQFISMELLVRICKYLNCTFDDVVEIINKEKIES